MPNDAINIFKISWKLKPFEYEDNTFALNDFIKTIFVTTLFPLNKINSQNILFIYSNPKIRREEVSETIND